MGYKNTGRGEICALITKSATMTKNRTMGIIHIFFDFVARIKSWRIAENITVSYQTTDGVFNA